MKFLTFLLLLSGYCCHSQSSADCEDFKSVTVYIYPKNSNDSFKVVRLGQKQAEYNIKTGDSTMYTVKWDDACQYTLTFVSTSQNKSSEQLDLLKKLKIECHIESIAANYYTYKSYYQKWVNRKAEDRHVTNDTAWLQPVSKPTNKKVFEPLVATPAYLKKHFRDTSGYAIVYFYREGKFMAMKNEYFVYCNNQPIFWATNKTKSAMKIFGNGPVKIHAKSGTVLSSLDLDVKPGKKYYVKCIIHHRVSRATPELQLVEHTQGELEYESIQ